MRLAILAFAVGAVALIWWAIEYDRRQDEAFYQNCLSIPKSEKECKMLLDLKQRADAASNLAAASIGFAAASSGGR